MQRLDLKQLLSQKLSPQQIQFIKLLQIPTAELEARIKEELEINPALEEGADDEPESNQESDIEDEFDNTEDDFNEGSEEAERDDKDELNLEDYINDDEIAGYKMQGDTGGDEEEREMPIAGSSTLNESLLDQLGFLNLDE